ncbi:unnamed protein product [Angiostrongylus costaricensis]|uniref:Neur_chan_LBD domain-containing protein n=1 Tax=Angiostrongylus costaricensis TaxID=334426 RepID=A0A158PLN1_ANGCS|nr:unnamed protein product [Angiostrongylus costaricensis]
MRPWSLLSSRKIKGLCSTKLRWIGKTHKHFSSIHLIDSSLSPTERNEISRKFKYYFNSVRSNALENFVSDVNGTFYRITVDFHLIATHIKTRSLLVEAVVVFHWIDDRLVLRELFDDFELPSEFVPWLPRVRTIPKPHTVTDIVPCSATEWKYPFESFECELATENAGAPFPQSVVHLKFAADWHLAVLSVFLPSLLIVALVFFAQWKRRKVQVLVSLAAIMCMLILLVGSRPYQSATFLDLWICGCFIHTAFLLVVDLTLPARRVTYALLVDADELDRQPRHAVLKLPSESVSSQFRLSTLSRTELFQAVLQREITTTSLGERKKAALLVVAASYAISVLAYCLVVLYID